jgi:molecular chaperone GrpE
MAKKKETKSNKASSKANAKQAEDNEEVKNELKTEKEKFLRLFAEFENFKRRTAKERLELFSTASEEVMVALLPVLDDFDRASNAIESENESVTGFVLIKNKLVDTLKLKGLSQFDVNIGDEFNADIHEAVTQIDAPSKKMKGKIIDVIEKGYQLGEKIIRYPKVVIGK